MRKLNDIETHERLHAASLVLGREGALTPAADSALKSARLALIALQMALVRSMETPSKPLPPPPY
jgi:hypothetical protein